MVRTRSEALREARQGKKRETAESSSKDLQDNAVPIPKPKEPAAKLVGPSNGSQASYAVMLRDRMKKRDRPALLSGPVGFGELLKMDKRAVVIKAGKPVIPNTFHRFKELPKELRLMIWEMAILPRNVMIQRNDFRAPGICEEIRCLSPHPDILTVCKESFSVASKVYTRTFTLNKSPFTLKNPPMPAHTWFNYNLDTLYITANTFPSLNIPRNERPFQRMEPLHSIRHRSMVKRLAIEVPYEERKLWISDQNTFGCAWVCKVLDIFEGGIESLTLIMDHDATIEASDPVIIDAIDIRKALKVCSSPGRYPVFEIPEHPNAVGGMLQIDKMFRLIQDYNNRVGRKDGPGFFLPRIEMKIAVSATQASELEAAKKRYEAMKKQLAHMASYERLEAGRFE